MRYVDAKAKNLNKMNGLDSNQKKIEKKKKYKWWIIVACALVLLVGIGFIFKEKTAEIFDPGTIVSTVTNINLDKTDERTNILLLGVDKRRIEDSSEVRTDTILFVSIGREEKNVVMLSLPRDLWVTIDNNYQMRINEVYDFRNGKEGYGVEKIQSVVEDITGMPVHYYSIVDFNMFKDAVNILGGIEVTVENDFVDYQYPVDGMENSICGRTQEEIDKMVEEERYIYEIFPCRYETIQFDSGPQIMDGDMALKFARSRKGTNGEDTDFARSRRQQKVIMALKDRALSLRTLVDIGKIKELFDLYSEYVDTNLAFKDIRDFYALASQVDYESVDSLVIDDRSDEDSGGLLYNPTDTSLYGGAYVLVPKAGDYTQIREYVQRNIYGDL